MPILFNLYTADPVEGESPRGPLLDCIRAYLSITEKKACHQLAAVWSSAQASSPRFLIQLLESLFSKLLSKLKESGTVLHVRTALEDIAEVFVPHLPLVTIEELFQLVKTLLDVRVE